MLAVNNIHRNPKVFSARGERLVDALFYIYLELSFYLEISMKMVVIEDRYLAVTFTENSYGKHFNGSSRCLAIGNYFTRPRRLYLNMGCNASKNVAVVPIDDNEGRLNGAANKDREAHGRDLTATRPREIDLEPGEIENAMVNNVQKAGNGMSFEITFDESEDKDDGLIEKQPPKRILELKEAENKEPVTLEKLQEKLDEAEIRRQQILQQRIQSANLLKRMKNDTILQSVGSDDEDMQSPHHLKIPKDEQLHPPKSFNVANT